MSKFTWYRLLCWLVLHARQVYPSSRANSAVSCLAHTSLSHRVSGFRIAYNRDSSDGSCDPRLHWRAVPRQPEWHCAVCHLYSIYTRMLMAAIKVWLEEPKKYNLVADNVYIRPTERRITHRESENQFSQA